MDIQTEPANIKWPKAIIKLTAKDFKHGTWSQNTAMPIWQVDPTSVCDTRCCAVGWVATAFGECAAPDGTFYSTDGRQRISTGRGWNRDGQAGLVLYPKGSPVYEFVFQFARNLGADMKMFRDAWTCSGMWALSDLFEEGYARKSGGWVSERTAARAWNKTLKDLGYTEECTVAWADEE